ncbi:putative dolichol-phosphate mannosyltransferase subunit 3 [Caenorhabditis elegans]|uniref:Probable dolichol-phosphate mannosyltransferase subunit 3 n=1 Tax=Caenorhabditis elegans TaxID=6239 RepID=DPM3_CAEEL|nr:putative dolichol-phosphate mannosyltransferase subunit 3 [Caenorhabditis elegans]Q9XVV5.1 RecName: Full=Probable dolichol-phosphate mannosyltransferase subunit 3; AltName: Full=Dolichol-phosphate mannose synthase subunit 3; Short=DPM synthase subunit 3; AltName: Full=Dolichyl-phosphate beta-D-mannosyltransferase subunit 3; AltName: Full=Mannose-P-dolichol synthase subunit 3; Short=MPD synthase subunit 3 [Caenorhabditis elegans]CAA94605.1 Probable dolichol-phosphate mannosyltransferase subunit|eukprot:NP_502366.1 Probable dolichol-phosphate mannosyltransferase subunit 3 [Caenorhabditis elegans]
MVSQLVTYSAHVILFVLVWLLAYTDVVPVLSYLPECLHCLVNYAPFFAVLFLGIYAVFNVVYGVATFNDCAEAKVELLGEIKEAREELKRKRIID